MASFSNEENEDCNAEIELEQRETKKQKLDVNCSSGEFETENESPYVGEPSYDEIDENDLPLLSNIDQVRVVHYLMKLRFDMSNTIVHGSLVLFLKWNAKSILNINGGEKRNCKQEVILDCCSIKVHKVSCLKKVDKVTENPNIVDEEEMKPKKFSWFTAPGYELTVVTTKWSLNFHGWNENEFPYVVRIEYETLPSTPSLHWRLFSSSCEFENSHKNVQCVYTPASPVNNRGLFPCQEPPSAMSTWECIVELETCKDYTALLASDEPGVYVPPLRDNFLNFSSFYYSSSMVLPMSTFAIAVGTVFGQIENLVTVPHKESPVSKEEMMISCKNHPEYPCRISFSQEPIIPVRLFTFDDKIVPPLFQNNLSVIMPKILHSAFMVLGAHPFSRLDLVIMPKCFPSLGLANPNMIFLSPSVFQGCEVDSKQKYSYCSRLAHEVSHSWFGLLIGALDWTEEWLSEGFATFMEDILLKKTLLSLENDGETENSVEEQVSIRSILRLMNLQNEMNNTEENKVQVLTPEDKASNCVKNALVPEKQFMQVHYLKGYFFLKYLSELVGGDDTFIVFLKRYIQHFHGQLVTSQMFLNYFQEFYTESSIVLKEVVNIEDLKHKWLQNASLEEPWKSVDLYLNFDNSKNLAIFSHDPDPVLVKLFPTCEIPLSKSLRILSQCFKENKFQELQSLSSADIVYLLESIILQADANFSRKFCRAFIQSLGLINVESMNQFTSEVLHCLCELIIKIKDKEKLPIVEKFLLDHPAMGVYIYGELMISEKKIFQDVARSAFRKLKNVLDKSVVKVLKEMLF